MAFALFLKDIFDKKHSSLQNNQKCRLRKFVLLSVVLIGAVWFSVHTMLQAYFDPITPVTNWVSIGQANVSAINDKIFYFLQLFSPMLFIPFLEPILLVPVLPYLAVVAVANHPGYWSIFYQYGAFTAPFIFYASTIALAKLKKQTSISSSLVIRRVFLLLLIANIAFSVNYSSVSPLTGDSWSIPTSHDFLLSSLLTSIPKNSTVLTQSQIYPHLTDSYEVALYVSSYAMRGRVFNRYPDFIVFDITQNSFYTAPALFNFSQEETVPLSRKILELSNVGNYGLYSASDGAYVFKENYTGELTPTGQSTTFFYVNENWSTNGTCEKLPFGVGVIGGKGVGAFLYDNTSNLNSDSFSLSYMTQTINHYGDDSWAGILMGFKDPENYISLNLRYPGGHISLVTVTDGKSEETIIGSIIFPSQDYQYFYLALNNGVLRIYVNSMHITTIMVDTSLFQGKIGLVNWQQDTNTQLLLLTET